MIDREGELRRLCHTAMCFVPRPPCTSCRSTHSLHGRKVIIGFDLVISVGSSSLSALSWAILAWLRRMLICQAYVVALSTVHLLLTPERAASICPSTICTWTSQVYHVCRLDSPQASTGFSVRLKIAVYRRIAMMLNARPICPDTSLSKRCIAACARVLSTSAVMGAY